MNTANQICALCSEHFSQTNLAWIISLCGHNMCSQCLKHCKTMKVKAITCKECKAKYNVDQEVLEEFPKNITILKNLRDSKNNSSIVDEGAKVSDTSVESSMLLSSASVKSVNNCPKHGKPLEIICIVDRGLLCAHCAIFGQHQNHAFKTLQEFDTQLKTLKTSYKELQLQKQICDQNLRSKKYKSSLITRISGLKDKLAVEIRDRFTKLSCLIKDAENKTFEELMKVIKHVDSEISKLTKEEQDCEKEYNRWKKEIGEYMKSIDEVTDLKTKIQMFYRVNKPNLQDGKIYLKEMEKKVTNIKEVIDQKIKSIGVEYATGIQGSIYNYVNIRVDPNDLKVRLEDRKTKTKGELDMFKEFEDIRNNRKEMKMEFVKSSDMVDFGEVKEREPNFKKEEGSKTTRTNLNKVKSNPKLPKAMLQKIETPKKPLTPPKTHPKNGDSSKHEQNLQHAQRMLNEFLTSTDTLDLTACELSDEQIIHIVKEGSQQKPIKCLKLCKNKLSNHGLAQLIEYLGSVTNVNLSYNGLTDECVDIFVDRREHLPCLRIINLAHNKVNERKVKAKTEELKKVGVITTL